MIPPLRIRADTVSIRFPLIPAVKLDPPLVVRLPRPEGFHPMVLVEGHRLGLRALARHHEADFWHPTDEAFVHAANLALPPELHTVGATARIDGEAIRAHHYAMEKDLVTIPGPAYDTTRRGTMSEVLRGLAAAVAISAVTAPTENMTREIGWSMGGGRRDKGWNPKRRKLEKAAKKKNRKRK